MLVPSGGLFMKSFSMSVAVALLLCLSQLGAQDGQQPAGLSKPVLKANTRLVVVDVVATDHDGQPVSGLEAQDFTVLEDGHPQKISGFNFQHPAARVTQVVLRLPPNVVSNVPQQKSSSLNVVLLDTLNGDFAGHAAAQDALVKYLDSAQLTQPLAIYAMQERLTMLHDFTTDNQALKAVVAKFKPPPQTNNAESIESRASAFTNKGDFHTGERNIESTLNQLHALARTLGGYPGRKNVIWLSESFPLVLAPETAVRDSISVANLGDGITRMPTTFDVVRDTNATMSYAALVKKVAEAMMKSQVAIYPVDSTGLTKDDHLASQHTMSDLAYSTGGKAFYNRNDLEVSLRTSLNDGSTYYTLTYYPDNKDWNGKFRTISIKTTRPGASLRYRLGYYALDPVAAAKDEPKQIAEDFSRALTLDEPSITAVQFQAGVVMPSDKTQGKVLVNFAIDPHTLGFERSDDGLEHASVNCVVWAFSGKGDPIRSEGNTLNAGLKPDEFQRMMNSYFPCGRSIGLKPGHYTLRLGVLDRTTNQIGTTTTEITVP
jgi:VWFA-related protein